MMVANGFAGRRGIVVVVASVLLVAAVGVGAARAMLSSTPMTIQPQISAGGYINDVEVVGDTAYIGGSFTTVGGQSRANLASFNLNTGVVTSWNPGANAAVTTLDVSGSDIYVGGSFTTIGTNSAARKYAAKIDSAGAATSWNPGMSAAVNAIDVRNSVAYIGGDFTTLGECAGKGVEISTTDGSSCNLDFPDVSGNINAIVPDGSGGWFIGGEFTSVGGVERNRIAHILSTGSLDTSWNPNADNRVYGLVVSTDGNYVYAGGWFTTIGGQSRNRIAKLSATGAGTADASWNPNSAGNVNTVDVSPDGTTVYAGGQFTTIGGQSRNRIAKISTAGSGTVDATWNPNANNTLNEIKASSDGNNVYAVGWFTSIGGYTRNRVAKLSATGTGGADASWNPNANNDTKSIALSPDGNSAYIGGQFSTVGGYSRSRIAKVSTSGSGTVDATWNPNSSSIIYSIVLSSDGNTVYTGGYFSTIGGQSRNRIAALDSSNAGNATSWETNANNNVYKIALSSDGQSLYVGGSFTTSSGKYRNRIAAVDANGAGTTWNPNADAAVNDLKISSDGNTIYAGGPFTTIGGQLRNRIAALNTSDSLATSWNPNANNTVSTLEFSPDGQTVYAGGSFGSIGGQSRNYLAALSSTTGNATSWNPDFDGSVAALAVTSGNEVFVAGSFSSIGAVVRYRLAKIDTSGNVDIWNPIPSQPPASLAMWGDSIVVGAGSPPFSIFGDGSDSVVRRGLAVFNDVSPPSNSRRPWMSGDFVAKQTVACNKGTWSSGAATTYSYEWRRGGGQVVGGNRSTYTLTTDDINETLYCSVTGVNFAGSTSATSAPVSITVGAASGGTNESSSCKTRGKIVSKSLRRALSRRKIRVKLRTNKAGSTVNLHLRADGVGSKLAARQNVTFSNGLTTKRVTMKLRRKAVRQLRKRANKRMKRGHKKVAMRLRVYCFYGGKKTRTSITLKMSVSSKKARSKKHSRSKQR